MKLRGVISSIIRDKSIGYITTSESKDFFFHATAVRGEGYDYLEPGDEVTFQVVGTPRGEKAVGIEKCASHE